MGSPDDDIIFEGRNGDECEWFIRTVHKAAYTTGKIRDNVWMADFAMPCLSRGALRFYESLDDEVKGDWKLLRQALLEKYPPMEDEAVDRENERWWMSPPTVPVAGPAPAPVTGTGRIKALGINYADFGYLADGQTMYHDGIGAGASATEALIFSYVRLDNDLFEIEIKRSDGKPQLLGVHWDSSDPSVSVGSLKHAVLAVFNYEGLLRSSKAGWPGPGYTRIWKIKPDNTLCPYFVEKDVEKPLRLLLHAASSSQRRAVDVAADPGAFLIKWGEGGGWVLVDLLFEHST